MRAWSATAAGKGGQALVSHSGLGRMWGTLAAAFRCTLSLHSALPETSRDLQGSLGYEDL